MSTTAINPVDRIRELGGELFLDGDKIRYRIPNDSPEVRELLESLRRDRDEVIRVLRERQTGITANMVGQGACVEPCCACGSRLFWHSIYGAVVCWTCHPPANEALVKSLLYDGEVKWEM